MSVQLVGVLIQVNERAFAADAHKLILGSAYQYKADVQNPQVSLAIKKFSDEHGIPAQRFYNVLCIAYGADQELFADVVEKGFLPKERAEGCDGEYEKTAFAFKKLIGPYIDKKLALTRRPAMSAVLSLSGVDRTSQEPAKNDAADLKRS
jgi:hypothetical protein